LATLSPEELRQVRPDYYWLRFGHRAWKWAQAYKANFNPDQPRVPAGNPDGGQWTSTGIGLSNRVRLADASGTIGSLVMSDASPDPVIPGAQYVQTEIVVHPSALTGRSTIDDTTKRLARTLAAVVDILPDGSGAIYGIAVHTVFKNAVRAQNIPGIGYFDVETTFSLADSFRYGSKDSIRTDVVLRNDAGDIIAIYDVKTGGATIRPSRAEELRAMTRTAPEVPVIELNHRRGVLLKGIHSSSAYLRRWAQFQINPGVINVYGA
jgi:hypothetical protein